MSALRDTLGNPEWLAQNEAALRELLPEHFTHVSNLNGLGLGFKLKLLGVDWRTPQEFGNVFVFLKRIGWLDMEGQLVRRMPKACSDV